MPNVSLFNSAPTDWAAQQEDILRRRKMAEMLQQQSMEPPQRFATNGIEAPISWTQGLAKILQSGLGAYQQQKLTEEQKGLASARNKALADALSSMPREIPAIPENAPQDGIGPTMPARPAVQPSIADQGAWMGQLAQLGPDATQIGSTMLNLQTRREEKAADREARMQERIMQLDAIAANTALSREERVARAQEADALRRELFLLADQTKRELAADADKRQREMQQFTIANRQPPASNVPKGYRETPTGLEAIPGGPADPKIKATRPMSPTAQKELISTEEEILGTKQALSYLQKALDINDSAMGFKGAGIVSGIGTLLPSAVRPDMVDATETLDNLVTGSALPQLKAIFGAMPTEGERAILLEMSGSVGKSPAVRKGIYERAILAAQNRMKFNKEKADKLRKGQYFNEQGGGSDEWTDL